MRKTVRFAPPHSIFSIADPKARDVPTGEDRDIRIWVTSDIIGVACFPSDDGETELTISTQPNDIPAEPPRVDVELPTPSHVVVVEQSDLMEVMKLDVPSPITRVRLWSNDPKFPDNILVVLG